LRKKVRTSFFEKKEAKKLLLLGGRGGVCANARRSKSFLVTFFQKSNFFLSTSLQLLTQSYSQPNKQQAIGGK
jgi:hypothetical protein